MSSSRSRNRPPVRRAACQPARAERTWPRWRYPVGLGANLVTTPETLLARVTARPNLRYCCIELPACRESASMIAALSGPSRPPAAGGKPQPPRHSAARAGRRRQRSDRAGALLGAAAARCRVPVAERALSLRHGALRLPVVQRPGPQPAGGVGRGARGGADARRLYRRSARRAGPRRRAPWRSSAFRRER